jgi:uncharacterized membrane protein YadS
LDFLPAPYIKLKGSRCLTIIGTEGVVPGLKPAYGAIVRIAKTGLTITLFLIGAGLSREALKSVGIRPIAQGIVLWAFISVVSLIAVRSFS